MISLNPMPEPLDAGSTQLIPAVRKTTANSRPMAAYAARTCTNQTAASIALSLTAVDRDHGSAYLRSLVGDQMNQKLCHLAGMNPFRVVRIWIGGAIGRRVHRARQHDVGGHMHVRVLASDRTNQRDQRGF